MVSVVDGFSSALGTVSDPINFVLLLGATLVGVIIGVIPGMGGAIALALLIPLTFGLDPLVAFMILAAAYGGTTQGAAITGILLNTPGKGPSAATILDGHPMARQGMAGRAVGIAATASALGALTGHFFLAASLPLMLEIAILFGSPEKFWLGVWGLAIISLVVGDKLRTGLISAGLGVLFAMYGLNHITAGHRWTFGQAFLVGGIGLIPALIGLFAVAEMINLISKGTQIAQDAEAYVDVAGGRWEGVLDVYRHKWIFLRSAMVGVVIGVIPGVGGTTANFVAYFQAVETSKNPESYGTGDPRGVVASEASNDAKDGAAYIPTLGFGIPGSAGMAILFGGFLLHGINPGPSLIEEHIDIVGVILVSAVISNISSSLFTYAIADKLAIITRVDIRTIAPLVLAVSFLAAVAIGNVYNIWITLFFGLLGFVMLKVGMSRIPMILGMVLAPIVEQNFFRSLQLSGGEYFIFVRSPITWLFIVITLLTLVHPYVRAGYHVLTERLAAEGIR